MNIPKKLPSAGMKRGASLPSHTQDPAGEWKSLRIVCAPQEAANGPMDLDVVELETRAMQAAGIPLELIPGRETSIGLDGGHPIPGGGSAA